MKSNRLVSFILCSVICAAVPAWADQIDDVAVDGSPRETRSLHAVKEVVGASPHADELRAEADTDTDETEKKDEEPKKEVKKDPADVRNAISNLDLVRDLKKLAQPAKAGLWEKLVDQPYFTPEVRAGKLLFHGQYEKAQAAYELLLKDDPQNPEYLAGELESILRQGREAKYKIFDDKLAALPADLRATSHMIRLQAENLLQRGKTDEASTLLKAFIEKKTKLQPVTADVLVVYNLYSEVLEKQASYGPAIVNYGKIVDLASKDLPEDPEIYTAITWAVHRVSVLTSKGKDVHRSVLQRLGEVVQKDGSYWPAHLLTASVLFDSHNNKDAAAALKDTLDLNPNALEARFLALDFAITGYQFEAAHQQLDDLKTRTEIAQVSAYEGRLRLKERTPERALPPLLDAVRKNPGMPEARGWLAGAYYLLNEKTKMAEQLQAIKTIEGDLHPVAIFEAAEILRDARQFIEAEKYYTLAQSLAQWWSEPPSALAQLYLETGQEDKAQTSYNRSFAIDPFNMRAYNQLKLLEILQAFQKIESTSRLKEGSTLPAFIIRYDTPDEVLAKLTVEWMDSIRPEIWSYFQITELSAPTQIEYFPTHEQFGVRTTGLPWIGTVGACTGNVIAMDVPRGAAKNMMGAFDWARVLRHEYTHTVTLAMTNNRVPHWLTEAAAVTQEHAPRDWSDANILASNYRAGTLFKIADLNWGFIRPKKPTDRRLAYMQSQWLYEFLTQTYGQDKMIAFFHAFRDGATEAQAWPKVYNKKMEEMDQDFLAWAGKQVEDWGFSIEPLPRKADLDAILKTKPEDPDTLFKMGWLLVSSGKAKEAETFLRRAIKADPAHVRAKELLGAVLQAQKKKDEARKLLEEVVATDPKRPVALRSLGLLAMADKDFDTAEKWFKQLQNVRPLEDTSYISLSGIYLLRKDNKNAIAQLSVLQRHEQRDERIPRKLADLYRAEGQLAEAQGSAYRAIRINPYNAINHRLMAQILEERKDLPQAIQHWKYTTELQPKVVDFWEGLANAQGTAGDKPAAAQAAAKALELEPDSAAKKWLQ